MKSTIKKISIIGDGGWGTTLAIHLSKQGHDVVLWCPFEAYVKETAKTRINKNFLPGYKIPKSVALTSDLGSAINRSDLIVLATPFQYLSLTLKKIKETSYHKKQFLSVIKGIDPQTFQTVSEIVKHELGNVPLAVLSGPTIASELAAGKATTAVVASISKSLASSVQETFNAPDFRIYTSPDVVGVEIGGSIKNVIAIACGVCDGLGLGTNAKAAILTRGLTEITRLGVALGGKRETFYGLSCLGDLATTCFSPNSRNRCVGEALGKGKSIKTILSKMHMVAEGVETSKAVYRLGKQTKIPMPIVEQVYKIIFESKKPRLALNDLMDRQLKAE